MSTIKTHWLKIVLILFFIILLAQFIWIRTISKKPALLLTETNIANLAEDDGLIRNGIVPLLKANMDNGTLYVPK